MRCAMSARGFFQAATSALRWRLHRERVLCRQSHAGTGNRSCGASSNGSPHARRERRACSRFAQRWRGLIDVCRFMDALDDTRAAFDSVAADYDGARGNNELIQDMRREMWRWLDATFVPGAKLIDLGCGTGLDAIRMAKQGHYVTATDWSPRMIERTADRAAVEGVTAHVQTIPVGAHELHRI